MKEWLALYQFEIALIARQPNSDWIIMKREPLGLDSIKVRGRGRTATNLGQTRDKHGAWFLHTVMCQFRDNSFHRIKIICLCNVFLWTGNTLLRVSLQVYSAVFLCLSGFAFKAAQFVKNERSRTGGAFNHIWQECKWTTIQADWTHDTTSNHNPGTLVKINLKGSTKSKVCDISLCHRDEVPCCSCGAHRCRGSRHQRHCRQSRGRRTQPPSQVNCFLGASKLNKG